MMLIPPSAGFGNTVETHKTPNYFINPSRTPPIINGNLPNSVGSITSEAPQAVGTYSAGENGLNPGRMQSELPGLGMYPGQAGSSALGSPVSYGSAPGSVGAAPGLMAPHYGATGIDPTSYYPPLGPTYDMAAGGGDMWSGGYAQPPPGYYSYENTFGHQYPYDSRYCGMDINDGVRRKNATRESTNTLKAWLQEHKKNPYPTKGEKIMLAIITKMTLTQVSTWFANARRRLKKENKMTWVPKNRSNEAGSEKKDDDEEDDEIGSQTQDSDGKLDIGQSIDSDDSAERSDVISTNASDVTSQYPRDLTSYPRNSTESTKLDIEGPVHSVQQGEVRDYNLPPPLSNTSETSHPSRYEGSEGSNPAIWSPVNEQDQTGYRPSMPHQPYQQYPGDNNQFSASSRVMNHSMLSPCRIPAQSWGPGQYQSTSTAMAGSVSSPCEQDVQRRDRDSNEYSGRQFGSNDATYARLSGTGPFGPQQAIYNQPKQADMTSSLSPNSRMTSSGYPAAEYYPERTPMQPYYPQTDISQRYNPGVFPPTGALKSSTPAQRNSPISGIVPEKRHPAHSPYYASATMAVTSSQQDSTSYQIPYFPQQEEIRNLPTSYNIRSPNRDSPNVEINVQTHE